MLFAIDPSLSPTSGAASLSLPTNLNLSPETTKFISSLSLAPSSPIASLLRRSPQLATSLRSHYELSTSPTASTIVSFRGRRRGRPRPAIPILLHDAPMSTHLSVGVQTWGSAILLGRRLALKPEVFGLFRSDRPVRVLELGAGTGLLSILCRKLLDLKSESRDPQAEGCTIMATDFLPEVLDNLKICVDLNFPSLLPPSTRSTGRAGIQIAKLDWSTFPADAEAFFSCPAHRPDQNDPLYSILGELFDVVVASDCVYEPSHAKMLRDVAQWVLRLPDRCSQDRGGVFVSRQRRGRSDRVAYPFAVTTDIRSGARLDR